MELNICHLYPDILNLYGDRGNIITMKRRLESRGISVNVDECSIGQPLDVDKYDIFFIGGGQDFEQEVLLRDLASGKGKDICTAVEEEKVFLAICGGYQMLGQYYKTWDGVQLDFIGAINVHTIGAKERMIGNLSLIHIFLDLCAQLYLKIGYIKLGDGTDAALAGLERLPKRRHIVADRSDGTHAGDYYTFHIFAPSFQYHDRTPVRC